MIKKRTTIYLEDKLVKLLKIRSVKTDQSMSEYISELVYQDLAEEKQDIADIKKILKEPTMSFEKVLKQLKIEDEV